MNFDYIMSGTGMAGFEQHNDLTVSIFREYFKDIDYKFSVLFNAMVEAKHGQKLNSDYGDYIDIMSDSGGLQIVTLGYSPEKAQEVKPEIFKTQATYSNIAMSFDDMPMHIEGESSGRLDLSNRFFVREKVKEAVKNSIKDLKEQIKVFQQEDTKCKVMVIVQGNDVESYKEYIESIVEQLSDDELKYIGGIAPSGASNGFGSLQRFDMLYGIKEYNIPDELKKNVHLLGVGSVDGLTPLTGSPEYFSFIDNLSFDSTSHARKYRIDGEGFGKYQFGKNHHPDIYKNEYKKIVKHYGKYFAMAGKYDLEYLIENSTYYSKLNEKNIWMYRNKDNELSQTLAHLIWLFVPFKKIEEIMNTLKIRQETPQKILKDIKTYDDYLYYRKHIVNAYKLKSNKVQGVETLEQVKADIEFKNTLKSLF